MLISVELLSTALVVRPSAMAESEAAAARALLAERIGRIAGAEAAASWTDATTSALLDAVKAQKGPRVPPLQPHCKPSPSAPLPSHPRQAWWRTTTSACSPTSVRPSARRASRVWARGRLRSRRCRRICTRRSNQRGRTRPLCPRSFSGWRRPGCSLRWERRVARPCSAPAPRRRPPACPCALLLCRPPPPVHPAGHHPPSSPPGPSAAAGPAAAALVPFHQQGLLCHALRRHGRGGADARVAGGAGTQPGRGVGAGRWVAAGHTGAGGGQGKEAFLPAQWGVRAGQGLRNPLPWAEVWSDCAWRGRLGGAALAGVTPRVRG